jgi:bifunctional enzyme CysN/CysC
MSHIDVAAWIDQHQKKDLLRLLTCGSVDDGKSTLIGRLLYDTGNVYEDHLAALRRDSTKHGTTGKDTVDLALLTDGLKAEREQGITIDVAYRYFSTDHRKFIIADCPGHEQYTRNMATGASACDLAIILMDAREGHGMMPQTRRHSYIVNLLGIRHVVLAVNKMDCIGWSETRFRELESAYRAFAIGLGLPEITCIPMSALTGDNVANRGDATPWYQGPTLLEHLENVAIGDAVNRDAFRMPVQFVLRPNLNFRGFAGTISSGRVAVGDAIAVLPAGTSATVRRIVTNDGDLPAAEAGQAITLVLDREVDASRGDMFTPDAQRPPTATAVLADVVWMHQEQLTPGRTYLVRTAGGYVPATVKRILYAIDVNTQEKLPADHLELNRIARVEVELSKPLVLEPYRTNRSTGAFVLIDRLHHATMAAGMVVSLTKEGGVSAADAVRLASDDLLAAIHALPAARIDAATRERLLAVKARIEAVL